MKRTYSNLLLLFLFACLHTSSLAQRLDTTAIINYIKQYKDISIDEMNRTGVPASITLAQGIHESGFGKSYLAQNTNNHFGIKCKKEWTGKTFKYTDDAPNECFRVYNNVEESYRDHSDFLKNRAHYAPLFLLDKYDYKAWAFGLKKAGYATNPKYPQIIIKTIEDFQLMVFDKGQTPFYLSTTTASVVKNETKEEKTLQTIEVESEPNSVASPAIESNKNQEVELPIPTSSVKKNFFNINGVKAIKLYTKKGETLDFISNVLKIEKADLLAFNDISDESPLSDGQVIFVQRKKKSNKTDKTYTVKLDDNMWSIAQKKGVRLSALLKRNKLQKGEEPAPKQQLVLTGKIKEKPVLRTSVEIQKSNKNIPPKDSIVRAKDTIYPELKSDIKLSVDSNTVLRWENDTKLLEKPPLFELKDEPQTSMHNTKLVQKAETVLSDSSNKSLHIVVKGDTMYNICKRYSISISQLQEWNNLPDNSIKLGQTLIVHR
ncbi:MAG TPA: LysM peptidoglycan-binding domain-containing protein [Chitinophagales bacterium]|jgi:LysM repeat protein|nr:LysM peptidoglycan-binding domain-containing protein [Chitinophagales bacterium]HQV78358.1 LysM peptidoglycan-binding domain-containing protein [Chitinophagales bacterium]HQW79509.1 LysM peptidoglycan-binding domain-containing protein [Chitinophagales bacterium]HRB69079.1 LysM peptidoglycan-binding domain-containing protein [Chitinophagales bacterium]